MDKLALPSFIQEDQSQEEEQPETSIDPDVLGNWKIVDLPIIVPKTGLEEYHLQAEFKVKLYRFREEEWKERGVGQLKILKHVANNGTIAVMWEDKIKKVRLNQKLVKEDGCNELKELKTDDKAWIWKAMDYSEGGQPILQLLCAKFTTNEDSQRFFDEFQKVCPQPVENQPEENPDESAGKAAQELDE